MQTAFTALLIGVLLASVISFVVMGLVQVRRSNALARQANQRSFRFSPEDQFAMPARFADFALFRSGHSLRAHNVTDGRLIGWPVRAFDFRYEVGHGPRRQTRHYVVTVVETDLELDEALLWSDRDASAMPVSARRRDGHVGCWSYLGSGRLAGALASGFEPFGKAGGSIQARRGVLMFCKPVREAGRYDINTIVEPVEALRALDLPGRRGGEA